MGVSAVSGDQHSVVPSQSTAGTIRTCAACRIAATAVLAPERVTVLADQARIRFHAAA
jgi:hypothetical protein